MEEFHSNCRFIFTCNFINKIIEPLHSRCTVVDFRVKNGQSVQLQGQFFERLRGILKKEDVQALLGIPSEEKVFALLGILKDRDSKGLYEFFENLKVLEKIARYKRVKIVVKPHPSINYLTKDLEKIFSGLTFSNSNIDTLLKKTIATISFSSTVIEDSICSKIPVILFDQWERYKHCESCSDVNRKNQLI